MFCRVSLEVALIKSMHMVVINHVANIRQRTMRFDASAQYGLCLTGILCSAGSKTSVFLEVTRIEHAHLVVKQHRCSYGNNTMHSCLIVETQLGIMGKESVYAVMFECSYLA